MIRESNMILLRQVSNVVGSREGWELFIVTKDIPTFTSVFHSPYTAYGSKSLEVKKNKMDCVKCVQ
jgi:hypothetical protein